MNARTTSSWILATVGLLGLWATAQADIQDGLDDMFMVTGTEAAVYESQKRGGVNMGALRIRAPINSINLVNLTAPELRAGCGGIDAYGGSFTFVNTEQFRQILRQIGANAIGYAFKLALATMCESCDKILTGLQDMMNAFTRMNVNSCQWAQGLVNDTIEGVGLKGEIKGMSDASASLMAEGWMDGVIQAFGEPGKWIANDDPEGADPTKVEFGNQTWNALREADVGALYGFAPGNLTHHEVLLNIAGSVMNRAPNDAEKAALRAGDVAEPLQRKLTFNELKRGKMPSLVVGQDANRMWECDTEARCLLPTGLAQWDFPGTDEWVRERLMAIADHVRDPLTAGTDHDPADIQFLGAVPFPVRRHLTELQGSDGLTTYVEVASEAIGALYAVALAETLAASIEGAFGRTDTLEMPKNVRDNLAEFRADMTAERARVTKEYGTKLTELEVMVKDLQVPNRSRAAIMSTTGPR